MLEAEGSAIRGHFDPGIEGDQWCARRLLVRIHSYTQQRLRQEIEPVTAQDFMRFLLRWQRVAPGTQREGRAGVAATIAQLQGFEIPASVWEESRAAEPRVRISQRLARRAVHVGRGCLGAAEGSRRPGRGRRNGAAHRRLAQRR